MEDLPADSVPTLEELQERHRAVARYRILLCEGRGERKRTQVAAGLTLADARSEEARLGAEMLRLHPEDANLMCRSLYIIELENPQECLSPFARARLQALAAASKPTSGPREGGKTRGRVARPCQGGDGHRLL